MAHNCPRHHELFWATKQQFVTLLPLRFCCANTSSRRFRYRLLHLGPSATLTYSLRPQQQQQPTTPNFRRMLPTRTFTACKTRPFKQIHRGFLQTRTADMTACVFVLDGPLLTRLPILRLLTFRLRLLLLRHKHLGNAANSDGDAMKHNSREVKNATFTAANLIILQRCKVWLNCSEPRIRAFRHAVNLLHDIRDAQPGSNSNQTRKRSLLWMRSRFCKVEPFRCHSYCFNHGPRVTASVHFCKST